MCAVNRREYKRQEERVNVVDSGHVLNFRFLSGSVLYSFPGTGRLHCQLKLRLMSEGGAKEGEDLRVWAVGCVVLPAEAGRHSCEHGAYVRNKIKKKKGWGPHWCVLHVVPKLSGNTGLPLVLF